MTVILICPCCASTVDADVRVEEQTFECLSCGQIWRMVVDVDRQATHSLS